MLEEIRIVGHPFFVIELKEIVYKTEIVLVIKEHFPFVDPSVENVEVIYRH